MAKRRNEPRPDLREQIDSLYLEATGATSRYGANEWVARLARVHPTSISRVLSGAQDADRIEAILAAIEVGRALGRRDATVDAKLAKMSDVRLLAKYNETGEAKYADELARRDR